MLTGARQIIIPSIELHFQVIVLTFVYSKRSISSTLHVTIFPIVLWLLSGIRTLFPKNRARANLFFVVRSFEVLLSGATKLLELQYKPVFFEY